MMIAQIAWKNIWRNRIRSFTVITSVVLGLWAAAFMMAYAFGMIEQRLADAIENEISHIQIHHPDYTTDYDPEFDITNGEAIMQNLAGNEAVKAASARVLAFGMINSPTATAGTKLVGIDPVAEDQLTNVGGLVVEGEYLESNDKNKLFIGQKLATKLKVKLRSKVVITFQDADNNIVAGAFRVKGIYKSYNSAIEELNVYLNAPVLADLLGNEGRYHEVAILLNDSERVDPVQASLSRSNPELKVESWKQLSPELSLMIESLDQSMIIFLIIILVALSFGIINTMLMAVLERVREIGMLMAIGMTKPRLFVMISLETIFMVMLATPIGLVLALTTIEYLGANGLDLSSLYAEGYAQYGFKSLIHPVLATEYYVKIFVLVLITSLLSSIYPAVAALRLDPVTAIRKV